VANRLGSDDVLQVFSKAVRALDYELPLDQKSVKRVVVLSADSLIRNLTPKKEPKPCLYATRTALYRLARKLRHVTYCEKECIVDVAVYAGKKDPYDTLITAESEAFADNIKKSSTSENSDYLWDFYKLLQVPSRVRLFVARIRTQRKFEILKDRINWLIRCYQNNLREGDRVFSLVLPTARRDCGSICIQGWQRTKGKLRPV
jgi:hypothetical protein